MLSGTACESYRYLDVVTSVTEAAGEADDDFLKAAEVARRDGLQNSHVGARRVHLPRFSGRASSWFVFCREEHFRRERSSHRARTAQYADKIWPPPC